MSVAVQRPRRRLGRARGARGARQRRGYSLVWFAAMVFGLLGVAALLIDVGLARLTQRQMQTAAQSAALEGASLQDSEDGLRFSGRTSNANVFRRQAASSFAAHHFDDDFNPAADARTFGAGPRVSFTGGTPITSEFNGGQDLAIPSPPVYKPTLQLNNANQADGDLVAGQFGGAFSADSDGEAFLARIRRTNEPSVAGTSESGGAVPYLFGQGALLHPDLRGRGIAVRAEAVADVRPVVRVGIRQTVNGADLPGAIPFAIEQSQWQSLTRNTANTIAVGSNASAIGAAATRIGESITLQGGAPAGATGYCAIFLNIGGSDVVVGFGWTRLGAFDGTNLEITKLVDASSDGTVAPKNATARLSEVWSSIPASIRTQVIAANRALPDPLRAPLIVQ